MKAVVLISALALSVSGAAWAQGADLIGQPIETDGPRAWTIDIDGAFPGGLQVGDDVVQRLRVSPHGAMALGGQFDEAVAAAPRALDQVDGVFLVAPFWDTLDLGCSGEGVVNALVEHGAVTVQWFKVSPAGCAPEAMPITFSARLERGEDDGLHIEFRYENVGTTGAFAPRAGVVLNDVLELFPEGGHEPPPPDRAKALVDGSSDGEAGVWVIEFERGGRVVGDRDLDGVRGADNCDRDFNPRQFNVDGDIFGDACDPNTDNDPFGDDEDNCVWVWNPDQLDKDGNGVGDACQDSDGDLIADIIDGCPLSPNTDQADRDGDGRPDACDMDIDGDDQPLDARDPSLVMWSRGPDLCQYLPSFWHFDSDLDGIGDACDVEPAAACKELGCLLEIDADGDGVASIYDSCPHVPDSEQIDTDEDGVGDACDPDQDTDGVPDIYAEVGLLCSPLICPR